MDLSCDADQSTSKACGETIEPHQPDLCTAEK